MKYKAVAHRLPTLLSTPLFGDRQTFGLTPQVNDPCWKSWLKVYEDFYQTSQTKGVGLIVNESGYKIMRHVNLENKDVLEIGAGEINHTKFWYSKPKSFTVVDNNQQMLDRAERVLSYHKIESNLYLSDSIEQLNLPANHFDIVLSFYSLEHIFPLEPLLMSIFRLLKNDGLLVGAIPNEGGFAWGLGRYLTSRRWFLKKTNINPDKIICWEHPNFADGILNLLDDRFEQQTIKYWPFSLPLLDLNLTTSFVMKKK